MVFETKLERCAGDLDEFGRRRERVMVSILKVLLQKSGVVLYIEERHTTTSHETGESTERRDGRSGLWGQIKSAE